MLHRLRLTCLLLAIPLVLVGCTQSNEYSEEFQIPDDKKNTTKYTIKFGRVPSVTVTDLLKQNAPLIRRLKKELNVNITYRFADDYRGIIEGMSQNEYDFAWLGPYSYVLSDCHSDTSASYRPLVRPVRRNDQGELSPEYRSIIFTHAGSRVKKLTDLRGKTFAFVDRRSTSGFLFPMARLMKAGLDPNTDFDYEFLNRHDRVVQEVNTGNYDAGATYNDARMEEFDSYSRANQRLPIVAKTRPIPTSPIVVSDRFRKNHPDAVEKFVSIMTNLDKTEDGKRILQSLKIARYQEASSEDYSDVRSVLKQLPKDLSGVENFCRKPL